MATHLKISTKLIRSLLHLANADCECEKCKKGLPCPCEEAKKAAKRILRVETSPSRQVA